LKQTLQKIDSLPDNSFDEIVDKYIEMNIAHPFMEGNGRSTRIWLDQILKKRLQQCVDWSLIGKLDYMEAMRLSPVRNAPLKELLRPALTDHINDREMFMKGIDHSYYYEEVD
jgi:cell filamentation protein